MRGSSKESSSTDALLSVLREALGPEYGSVLDRLENYFSSRYGKSFIAVALAEPLQAYREASGLVPEYVVRGIFAALLRLRSEGLLNEGK